MVLIVGGAVLFIGYRLMLRIGRLPREGRVALHILLIEVGVACDIAPSATRMQPRVEVARVRS